jgi:hypothetical protein
MARKSQTANKNNRAELVVTGDRYDDALVARSVSGSGMEADREKLTRSLRSPVPFPLLNSL